MATPPDFTAGQVLTAAQMNAVGLWKITPTSVAGSGVSVSGSNVVFTSASTISVNGVFSADYDYYKIILYLAPTSGSPTATFRYRTGGSDNSSANYNYFIRSLNSGTGLTSDVLNRSQTIADLSYLTTVASSYVWEIQFPFDSSLNTFSQVNGVSSFANSQSGWHMYTSNVSFDGFSIIASTASYTGKLSVYGYNY